MELASLAGAGYWEDPGADAPLCGPAAGLGPCRAAAGTAATAGRRVAPPSPRGSHGDRGGYPAGLQAGASWADPAPPESGREVSAAPVAQPVSFSGGK